jgi:hypothetical protein
MEINFILVFCGILTEASIAQVESPIPLLLYQSGAALFRPVQEISR